MINNVLNLIGWKLCYFDYWLMHLIYFSAGLIILLAIASNKFTYYRNRMIILKRLEEYSKTPTGGFEKWILNQ